MKKYSNGYMFDFKKKPVIFLEAVKVQNFQFTGRMLRF